MGKIQLDIHFKNSDGDDGAYARFVDAFEEFSAYMAREGYEVVARIRTDATRVQVQRLAQIDRAVDGAIKALDSYNELAILNDDDEKPGVAAMIALAEAREYIKEALKGV